MLILRKSYHCSLFICSSIHGIIVNYETCREKRWSRTPKLKCPFDLCLSTFFQNESIPEESDFLVKTTGTIIATTTIITAITTITSMMIVRFFPMVRKHDVFSSVLFIEKQTSRFRYFPKPFSNNLMRRRDLCTDRSRFFSNTNP